jgi:ABC-type dipeptide/oligopeptide/nickel transport system permease subunit
MESAWWMSAAPVVALVAITLGFTLFADVTTVGGLDG